MMMMGGNPKRFAELIVDRIPKDGGADENARNFAERAKGIDDPVDEAELAAAEDILRAFESKDAHGLALALKDAFQIFDRGDSQAEGE